MRVYIRDISDAKRKLAKIIREYETDRITTDKFRSLVYGLSKYVDMIKSYDLEERVKALEKLRGIE